MLFFPLDLSNLELVSVAYNQRTPDEAKISNWK